MQEEKFNKQYQRWGAPLPSHDEHGTPDDIRERLQKSNVESWHLEGNVLVAKTQHGEVRQSIPPNYICHGMSDEGLPLLQKIGANG